jgi:hypothetical protein
MPVAPDPRGDLPTKPGSHGVALDSVTGIWRYRAGRCMDFDASTPETIGRAIAEEIGRTVDYRPVETDGAARAAALIAELL